jgi:hypothetical protein
LIFSLPPLGHSFTLSCAGWHEGGGIAVLGKPLAAGCGRERLLA